MLYFKVDWRRPKAIAISDHTPELHFNITSHTTTCDTDETGWQAPHMPLRLHFRQHGVASPSYALTEKNRNFKLKPRPENA